MQPPTTPAAVLEAPAPPGPMSPEVVTAEHVAAAWDRLQRTRDALSAAHARYVRDRTSENHALLGQARAADAHSNAEYTRLYQLLHDQGGV
jgi:Tar ligand binding domain homologue